MPTGSVVVMEYFDLEMLVKTKKGKSGEKSERCEFPKKAAQPCSLSV